MPKHRLKTKGPRTKVRTRHMYDGIQGTTVRVLDAAHLPTGCCVLKAGIPCTYRMVSIDMKVERMWVPSEQAEVPVVKVLGYCKGHTPKHRDVIPLGHELERRLNGPKSQRSRMEKRTKALYVYAVPQNGSVRHLVERGQVVNFFTDGFSSHEVTTACGRLMKESFIPTSKEVSKDYPKECPKCITSSTIAE